MNQTTIKSLACGVLSTISAVFGWRGLLVLLWIVAMICDYASGSAAAAKSGEWSSTKAREGLWHKSGMFFAVGGAIILDLLIPAALHMGLDSLATAYKPVLMPVCIAWYTITEVGSIFENAALLGASIPPGIKGALKVAKEKLDETQENPDGKE